MESNGVIYAEVYEILSKMDKSTVMKIPMDILNVFKNQRDRNYISKIDVNDLFNPNNVDKKTRDIIAWLDLEYWATEEEKIELTERYRKNEIIAEQKKKEEYNKKYNEIFDEKNIRENSESYIAVDDDKQMCNIKNNWFDKIKVFFKEILKKY